MAYKETMMIDHVVEGSVSEAGQRLTRSQWRTIVLASLGGALDYFDFVVYAVFARYIGAAFFPMTSPLISIMLTFSVYAVGMFARPLGGMALSHFGDKYGRRGVFLFSIFIMSVATLGIGLLPTYATLGMGATVLLVLMRLIQGMSVGGESPNAMTFVVEAVPHRASFVTGLVQTCIGFGVLLAAGINVALTSNLSPESIGQFGWRIPFLVGGVLGLAGFVLRRQLDESPEFSRMRQVASASKAPIAEMFREYRKPLLVGIGVSFVTAAYNGMLFAYLPAYLTGALKYAPPLVAKGQTLALIVMNCGVLFFAWVGDRVPRHWLLRIGAVLILVLAVPFYMALISRSVSLLALVTLAGAVGGFANGVFACILADLFPTRVRFSGSAFCTNISVGFISGLAPLVTTILIGITGSMLVPAFYLMFFSSLALIASLWLPRLVGHIPRHDVRAVALKGSPAA